MYLLILLLTLPSVLRATQQSPDVIFYEGKKCELETSWMFKSPLEAYFTTKALTSPYEAESTGNYRGHIATWEIDRNNLFLTAIDVHGPMSLERKDPRTPAETEKDARNEVRKIFPKAVDGQGKVFADWFTGNLRVFANPGMNTYKSPDDDESYEISGYTTVVILQIKNGAVTRATSFPWEDYWRKFETARAYRALPVGEKEAIAEHLTSLDSESKGWEDLGSIEPEGPARKESDFSAFLTRYINTPIKIPLTKLVIVKDVTLPDDERGWTIDSDLLISPGNAVFFIEMGSTNVPAGPWTPFTSGAVQVLVRLPKLESQKIALGKANPAATKVINNFLRSDDASEKIEGHLTLGKFSTSNAAVQLDGVIQLFSAKPASHQEVVFKNTEVPILDLKTYLEKFHLPGEKYSNDAESILKQIQKKTGEKRP